MHPADLRCASASYPARRHLDAPGAAAALPGRAEPAPARPFDRGALAAALALCLLPAGAAGAATLVVDGVVCTLPAAIDSANADADVGGCTGAGPYGADQIFLDADAALSVPDPGASDVGGAFAGLPDVTTVIAITARDGTVIDRDLPPCHESGSSELRLLNVLGAGADLTLEGVTLFDGCVASTGSGAARGGAVYVSDGRLVLDGVTLEANTIITDSGPVEGAALYASNAAVEIRDSRIEGNVGDAISGGGRAAVYVTGGASSLEISGSTFADNESRSLDSFVEGGALNVAGPAGTIADTVFAGNLAAAGSACNGGALYVNDPVDLVERVIFRDNTCSSQSSNGTGGGMYIAGSTNTVGALTDCLFEGNLAVSLGSIAFGGGLHVESPLGALERCAFLGNVAQGASTPAAGFRADGGGMTIFHDVTRMANVTFAGNAAMAGNASSGDGDGGDAEGGAVYVSNGDQVTKLTEVTMWNNHAVAGSGSGAGADGTARGGGLFVGESGAVVEAADNNAWFGNDATASGATAAEDCRLGVGGTGASFTSSGHNWVGAPANCAFGEVADVVGVDPGFGALADHGCPSPLPDTTCVPTVALEETSLALDWGSCAISGATLDARGAPRPVDFPPGNPADACDVGAFERQLEEPIPTPIFADGFESGDTAAWSLTAP